MSGQKHVVEQGECLSSIAAHYRLPDYKAIYDSPDNSDFRKKRPNPNVIYPGDEIVIPRAKKLAIDTGNSYTFVAKLPTIKLRLNVFDDIGATPTKADYELRIPGEPEPITGSLAGGLLETMISARVRQAHLIIRSAETGRTIDELDLVLGALDPVETVSGAQMRLQRLGFDCGPVSGEMNPATEAALRLFQRVNQLTEDGACSAATQAKLKDLAGV